MVNYQHILVSVTIIFAFVTFQTKAQDNPEISKLEKHYYDKCLKNSGNAETFNQLRTDVYELYKYFEYTFLLLPDQRKTFCKNEKSNLMSRIEKIEQDLKPCLPHQEKYLAGFIKESFKEFLHFLCHNDGEYTKRFFNEEGSQCRKKIEESNSKDLENCLNRIFSPTRDYITKSEMCDDITVARKCFVQLLEVHCPTSYNFKRLNEEFFNFVSKPCSSGCAHFLSSVVLIASLLVNFLMGKVSKI